MKIFQFITFCINLQQVQTIAYKVDKTDGSIISLDGKIKHVILFDYGLFNKIFDKIKYLVGKKSGITNSINHNFVNINLFR